MAAIETQSIGRLDRPTRACALALAGMPTARVTSDDPAQPRWPGTLAWFLGLTAAVSLWLYAGPVTPSPGDVVPSLFMGAVFGGILTVLIRSGFQQRPRWDDDTGTP